MAATDRQLVELQETLYTSRNPTRRWLHCSRRDWIISAIQRFAIGKVSRSLEVGPGAGGYLGLLASVSQEVTASDIEMAYLEHAQKLTQQFPNLRCVVDDITNTQLGVHSFDLILCTEVVEHIEDGQSAIQGLKKLLKPDGVIVFSTPQPYSPIEVACKVAFFPVIIDLVRMIYREAILENGHINLMTEKKLKSIFNNVGIAIIEQYKVGLYLPLIAEFMGHAGLHIEQLLEKKIRDSIFDWMLWNQCYILRASC
jgi:2-polyprenyl-3-methyl-5-hydroxy-6-metoxy-1,4-benzoquinol methylase